MPAIAGCRPREVCYGGTGIERICGTEIEKTEMGLEKVRREIPGVVVNVPLIKEVVCPAAIVIQTAAGHRRG